MNYSLRLIAFSALIFSTLSCSKDDDPEDKLYNDTLRSAKAENLMGTWSIYTVAYEGREAVVPVTYEECGRDFFTFSENGIYNEYSYTSGDCGILSNTLQWKLDEGIINIKDSYGENEELIITHLDENKLTFKLNLDVDQDGKLDIALLTAKKYVPKEHDSLSSTFQRDYQVEFEDEIRFIWKIYPTESSFERYEIFRNTQPSKENATKIASITDFKINFFSDTKPALSEKLYYFLRIYSKNGLLGESLLLDVDPQGLSVATVNMQPPQINGENIILNWEPSSNPLFSHYEIYVGNNDPGISGYGQQEFLLTKIEDQQTSTFADSAPPYFSNPVYSINAVNIFGKKSNLRDGDLIGSWLVDFTKKGLIDLQSIENIQPDPDQPVLYIFGQPLDAIDKTVIKYNYSTQSIEAIADKKLTTYTSQGIQLITTSENGKEIMVPQGSSIFVYDAENLNYKYALELDMLFGLEDFKHVHNDIWIFVDGNSVYTFKRDNANLFLIDKKTHFSTEIHQTGIEVIKLSDNQVLLGHFQMNTSILFDIDNAGYFSNTGKSVAVPFSSSYHDPTLYNEKGGYLLNVTENRLFSTETFKYSESFETPYFPTGISSDGNQIYGSNNDPEWQIEPESLHKKEAVIYDRINRTVQKLATQGYPHFIFQDYRDQILSISSGLKRERLDSYSDRASFFVEEIKFQN